MNHTRKEIARYARNVVNFLDEHSVGFRADLERYDFQVLPIPGTRDYLHVLNVAHNHVISAITLFYFVSGAGTPLEVSFGARFSKPHIRVSSPEVFEGYMPGKRDHLGNIEQILKLPQRDFSGIKSELARLAEMNNGNH